MSTLIRARKDWTSTGAAGTVRSLSVVNAIYAHHNGAHDLHLARRDHSACLDRLRSDRSYHVNTQGWVDIGYNVATCPHLFAWNLRGLNRVPAAQAPYNTTGIAVYFLRGGNDPFPAEWQEFAHRLFAEIDSRVGRTLNRRGHRNVNNTACPGSLIGDWVNAGAPAPKGAAPKPTVPAPKPTPPSAGVLLVVDGRLGPRTIDRWQQVAGTHRDGIISEPRSALVLAVQRRLNALNRRDAHGRRLVVDGKGIRPNLVRSSPRTNTQAALQRHLGTYMDGVLSNPRSAAVMELQRRLNRGSW